MSEDPSKPPSSSPAASDASNTESADAIPSRPAAGMVAAPESPKKTQGEDMARSAGRGGLAVAFAKIYFILLGLVQQIALPRVIGLAGYGALSNVLSIASIAYNPVVTCSIQGVSRAVAQTLPEDQPAAIRRTLTIHGLLTIPLAVTFFLLAPTIGRNINAPHLTGGLRLVSGVMLFYGLYAPLIGVLNGQKRFIHQAAFDMLAATMRTIGLVGGAWYFAKSFDRGVEGGVGGFVVSAGIVFFACLAFVGIGRASKGGPTTKQHVAFLVPLLAGQVLLNMLLQADLTLLRTYAAESAAAAGLPLEAADPLVGAYRATQLFCFLPYQLLIAVTFILFPMLASAYRDGDREAVAHYVRTGVRLALVLAGVMVSVTSGLSGSLLRLVFPAEAAELGTESMQLLTLGFGFFAILGIFNAVLTSLKREIIAACVIGLAVLLVGILCVVTVRGTPFGSELLLKTAKATSVGLVLATLSAAFFVKNAAGAVVAPLSLLRVLFALAVAVTVGRYLPEMGKLMTLVFSALVAAVYVAVLLLTKELTRADAQLVARVVARKKS